MSKNSIRKLSEAKLSVLSLRISSSIIIWNWSTSSVMLFMFCSICSKWLLIDCSASSSSRISFRSREAWYLGFCLTSFWDYVWPAREPSWLMLLLKPPKSMVPVSMLSLGPEANGFLIAAASSLSRAWLARVCLF